jgi:capsid protein
MKIFGYEFNKVKESNLEQTKSTVYQGDYTYGHSYPVINKDWDGEKTLGELGIIVRDIPNYEKLRLRSYHAYATIDTVKIIASKFFNWVIGVGLKLQVEPNRIVLESEGIFNDKSVYAKFQKNVEARFMVYSNSKECDYLKEKNLHELALDAFQGMFLGGDMLVIARFDNNGINLQLLSGEHVCNPGLEGNYYTEAKKNGNFIEHGIEIDKRGAHVAYFVSLKQKDYTIEKFERIPAKGAKTGKRLAWLISGKKICSDHLRGVPAMSQSLEKINKLDRYVEAAVTNAEQGAKIVYSIEHQEFSTGENPLDQALARKRNPGILQTDNGTEDTRNVLANGLANTITQTTGGQTYNMPNGSSLKAFDSKIETNFNDFHSTIFKQISAGVEVPPEVAMQEFNSNYSASRAAINSFGYIILINRQKFANDFYIPFYKLWLEWQILNNKIDAPGYIENIGNFMVTESYTQCRFTGKNMPHIDPLKEIKAVREMLGIDGATPLISREQAVEMLNAGQWDENFMKSLEEEGVFPAAKVEPLKPIQNAN